MHEIRKLGAAQGWEWVAGGWDIFRRQAGMLVLLFVIFSVILLGLGSVPIAGQLIALLATPALMGGLLVAIETTAHGQAPGFGQLFAAFSDPRLRGGMLTLGLWTLVVNVIALLAAILLGGSFIMSLLGFGAMGGGHMGGMALVGAGAGIGLFALLGVLLLALIYAAALFFAVPLVMLADMAPLAALKLSLRANMHNIGAWLIFGLVYLALTLVAMIPLGLGLLIIGPMSIASTYCAYLDTFTSLARSTTQPADRLPPGSGDTA